MTRGNEASLTRISELSLNSTSKIFLHGDAPSASSLIFSLFYFEGLHMPLNFPVSGFLLIHSSYCRLLLSYYYYTFYVPEIPPKRRRRWQHGVMAVFVFIGCMHLLQFQVPPYLKATGDDSQPRMAIDAVCLP